MDLEILENENYNKLGELSEEEMKYAIPQKMLEAAEYITQKLKMLNVDEFGDKVYEAADVDNTQSQSLKKA